MEDIVKATALAILTLFAGDDMGGWIRIAGQWSVANNAITCTHAPASIRTAFESDRYTLEFEYRGAGRVYVHSKMTTGGMGFDLPSPNGDKDAWTSVLVTVEPDKAAIMRNRTNSKSVLRGRQMPHPDRGFIRFEADKPGLQIRNVRVSEPGFRTMFDDHSLDDWEIVRPANPDDPGWVNENGVVRCRSRRSSWLRTLRTYDNFILRLEYEMPPAGNSGIFIRAPIEGRVSRIGMEIQLLDDAAFRGRIGAAGRTGSIYDGVAPEVQVPAPAKQWNAIEVLCNGKRVRTTLNAIQLYDVQVDNAEKDTNSHKRPLATRRTVGFIGLQDHSHPVKFRRVRIQELEPRPSATP